MRKCVKTFVGHAKAIVGLSVANNDYVVSGGAEGIIKVWKEQY
jgi:hypothetical protein